MASFKQDASFNELKIKKKKAFPVLSDEASCLFHIRPVDDTRFGCGLCGGINTWSHVRFCSDSFTDGRRVQRHDKLDLSPFLWWFSLWTFGCTDSLISLTFISAISRWSWSCDHPPAHTEQLFLITYLTTSRADWQTLFPRPDEGLRRKCVGMFLLDYACTNKGFLSLPSWVPQIFFFKVLLGSTDWRAPEAHLFLHPSSTPCITLNFLGIKKWIHLQSCWSAWLQQWSTEWCCQLFLLCNVDRWLELNGETYFTPWT